MLLRADTTKKFVGILFAAQLAGCASVYTTQPIVAPEQSVLDVRLAGTWAPVKADQQIKNHPTNYYLRIGTAADGKGTLETFEWSRSPRRLLRHQTFQIFCASPAEIPVCTVAAPEGAIDYFSHSHWRVPSRAPYLFARYELRGPDEVAVYPLSAPAVKGAIKGGTIEGEDLGAQVILDLPAETLQDYLSMRPELFMGAPEIFRRIDESVFGAIFVTTQEAGAESPDVDAAKLTILIDRIQNASLKMQYVAIEELAELGMRARPAVPALTEVLWHALVSDDHRVIRSAQSACRALTKIGEAAPETLRALEYLSRETDDDQLKAEASATFKRLLVVRHRSESGKKRRAERVLTSKSEPDMADQRSRVPKTGGSRNYCLGDASGFVANHYLKRHETHLSATHLLNMRAGPSTEFPVVCVLPKGALVRELPVAEHHEGLWLHVEHVSPGR